MKQSPCLVLLLAQWISCSEGTSTSAPVQPPAEAKSNVKWIVLGVVLGVLLLTIIGIVVVCLIRRKRGRKRSERQLVEKAPTTADDKAKAPLLAGPTFPGTTNEEPPQKVKSEKEKEKGAESREKQAEKSEMLDKTQESNQEKTAAEGTEPCGQNSGGKPKHMTAEYWKEDSQKLLEGEGAKKETAPTGTQCLDEAEWGYSRDVDPRAGMKLLADKEGPNTDLEETAEVKAQKQEMVKSAKVKTELTQESSKQSEEHKSTEKTHPKGG